MIGQRETFLEYLSKNLNYLTGGSLREMFCAKLLREERYFLVYYINWVYFYLFGDITHCQRVEKEKSKK